MAEIAGRLWRWSNAGAWALLVLLLPLTSLPLLARLARSETVAAASAIPLAFLIVSWFIPYLLRGGRFPKIVLPVLGLVCVMILASAAAFFIDIPPFKGISLLKRETQTFLTLAIGMGFYLVTSAWADTPGRLRLTLQLVNLGGLVMIAWSLVQAYYWYEVGSIPASMVSFQRQLSLTSFFVRRVNGFAYEPSWLAHMLNMVYLPWWLAASVRGYSVHRFRLLRISVENVLLVLGGAVLFLSSSRVGLISLLLMLAYLVLMGTLALIRKVRRWLTSRTRMAGQGGVGRSLLSGGLLLFFAVLYAAGAVGAVYVASRYDPRMARLFSIDLSKGNIFDYANQLIFAERLVYWATGWAIFGGHPFLGVGLGNAGYFFPTNMPGFGWALTEVNNLMFRMQVIPNTKSLWTRILAETGIVGFAFWSVWLYVLWMAGRFLREHREPVIKALGWMGALALISLLAEGFSIDSLALPYLWFTMGLISAATRIKIDQTEGMEAGNPVQAIHTRGVG